MRECDVVTLRRPPDENDGWELVEASDARRPTPAFDSSSMLK